MSETLYARVADLLQKQIDSGVYAVGDRLPSIRSAVTHFRVSVSTIQLAYRELENRRLAEARPRSGYYVLAQVPAPKSVFAGRDDVQRTEPVTINQSLFQLLSQEWRAGLVNLGLAYPHPDLLPVNALRRIVRRLSRLHIERILAPYGSVDIDLELRRQLARSMLSAGCEVGADDVLITNGCKNALALCLGAIVQRGDIVAVESPTFPGVLQLLEVLGARALEIPTHPVTGISIEALELALEQWPIKACAVMPTCQNPLGFSMPPERRQHLVDLARSARLPLIEDDIFGDLGAHGRRPPALKALDPDGRVLYCSSVSKSLGAGLRVGWAVPGRYLAEVRRLKAQHSIANNSLSEMVVAEYLAGGGYDRHLRKLVDSYRQTVRQMVAAIRDCFPAGCSVSQPAGGYLIWVRLPASINTWMLYQEALRHNISILPGHLCSAGGKFRACFRLSAAMPWTSDIERAIAILGQIASRLLESGEATGVADTTDTDS